MTQSAYATSQAGVKLTANQVKPDQVLGQTAQGEGGAEFIFVKFAAATVAGDFVWMDKDHTATKLTTASSPAFARCGAARTTSANANEYGWVQIAGQAPLNIAASAIANTRLNTTATAGRLDDDATTGAKVIERVFINTTQGGAAGVAEATLSYPTVGATL